MSDTRRDLKLDISEGKCSRLRKSLPRTGTPPTPRKDEISHILYISPRIRAIVAGDIGVTVVGLGAIVGSGGNGISYQCEIRKLKPTSRKFSHLLASKQFPKLLLNVPGAGQVLFVNYSTTLETPRYCIKCVSSRNVPKIPHHGHILAHNETAIPARNLLVCESEAKVLQRLCHKKEGGSILKGKVPYVKRVFMLCKENIIYSSGDLQAMRGISSVIVTKRNASGKSSVELIKDALFLGKDRNLVFQRVGWVFKEVLFIIESLHDRGVCHLDIRAENLIVDTDKKVVSLVEFGSAIICPGELGNCSPSSSSSSFRIIHQHYTKDYTPPELFTKPKGYHPQCVDIWCLGVLLFLLSTGEFPFGTPGNEEMFRSDVCSSNFRVPEWVPQSIQTVLLWTLHPDPSSRPTAKELLDLCSRFEANETHLFAQPNQHQNFPLSGDDQ